MRPIAQICAQCAENRLSPRRLTDDPRYAPARASAVGSKAGATQIGDPKYEFRYRHAYSVHERERRRGDALHFGATASNFGESTRVAATTARIQQSRGSPLRFRFAGHCGKAICASLLRCLTVDVSTGNASSTYNGTARRYPIFGKQSRAFYRDRSQKNPRRIICCDARQN